MAPQTEETSVGDFTAAAVGTPAVTLAVTGGVDITGTDVALVPEPAVRASAPLTAAAVNAAAQVSMSGTLSLRGKDKS